MPCPDTGATLRRGVRPFTVTYKDLSRTVDLPGYYPEGDGESVHVGDDMAATDAALRELRLLADGIPPPDAIRALRKKLGLSQRAAGELFRVGGSAFDKYERGIVLPSGPTVQLMTLLDRHPELAGELARDHA
jgi:HTH-type transcriptional regulator/antitoxin MqsA